MAIHTAPGNEITMILCCSGNQVHCEKVALFVYIWRIDQKVSSLRWKRKGKVLFEQPIGQNLIRKTKKTKLLRKIQPKVMNRNKTMYSKQILNQVLVLHQIGLKVLKLLCVGKVYKRKRLSHS
jgi:hypothetical protein